MRILQITNKSPWPSRDGGAIASMNLTKGFGFLGHKVTVLSMNTEKHKARKKDIPENLKALADFHFVDVPRHGFGMGRHPEYAVFAPSVQCRKVITEDFSQALIKLLQKKNTTSFNSKAFICARTSHSSGGIPMQKLFTGRIISSTKYGTGRLKWPMLPKNFT